MLFWIFHIQITKQPMIFGAGQYIAAINHPTNKNILHIQDALYVRIGYYSQTSKKWFEDSSNGYLDGYHLDKDILVKGNKVYSPETCCFVPQEINKLLTSRVTCRGSLPIGVVRNYGRGKPYTASMTRNSQHIQLGSYNTPLEAFNAYKFAKETHIKELAEKYFQEGKITEKVYNALMKYEVEITD